MASIVEMKPHDNTNCILSFKTKEKTYSLTTRELTKNLAVIGSTGSGKTKSVLLPMISNSLSKGHAGLVFDAKNEIYEDLVAISRKFSMPTNKLVSIGMNQGCFPVNLFKDLTLSELKEFLFESLKVNHKETYWLKSGLDDLFLTLELFIHVRKIKDDFHFLYNNPEFLLKLLSDRKLLKKLYYEVRAIKSNNDTDFDEDLFDPENELAIPPKTLKYPPDVLERILEIYAIQDSDNFSMCTVLCYLSRSDDQLNQYTWRMSQITSLLQRMSTKTLKENFMSKINILSPAELIFKGNYTCVFTGDMTNVEVTKAYAKLIKFTYYKQLSKKDKSKFTFTIFDDYPFIASGNDTDEILFNSITRSYNQSNIFCLQSFSSLVAVKSHHQARMLFQDCVNKIFLNCQDDETFRLAEFLFTYKGESVVDKDIQCMLFPSSKRTAFIRTESDIFTANIADQNSNLQKFVIDDLKDFKEELKQSISYNAVFDINDTTFEYLINIKNNHNFRKSLDDDFIKCFDAISYQYFGCIIEDEDKVMSITKCLNGYLNKLSKEAK